jgi:hypothetical protein
MGKPNRAKPRLPAQIFGFNFDLKDKGEHVLCSPASLNPWLRGKSASELIVIVHLNWQEIFNHIHITKGI